jgi:circadian clock protein KaiC
VHNSTGANSVFLWRFFEPHGLVKKAISVLKRRSGKHENSIREISFSDNGLAVSEPLREFRGILSGVPQFLPEGGLHRN